MDDDLKPDALAIPDLKGKAPEERIKNAHQAWSICSDLERQDAKRSKKRSRIFKAYNRFPPSEYSTLFKRSKGWQSNVNFGMMGYIVDGNIASFFDMLTERPLVAQIKTKKGNPKEKVDWSDKISIAFDKVFKDWDEFLTNSEQDLLDMGLFGKGLQMWDDDEGCTSEHLPAGDILVPEGTKINFCNFDLLAIKRKYSLHELWKKVESGVSGQRGWNRKAVLRAMRYCRKDWSKKYQDEEVFAKAIAEGDVTPGAHLEEYVDTYTLFVKEFESKKISRYTVLRDYTEILSLTKARSMSAEQKEESDKRTIKDEGFLCHRKDWRDSIEDIFAVFMDSAGSGMWHNVPSLAEKIFVQCRQYDFTMNAIMDAVKVNMSLMLQAANGEAHDKIKELVFGPYTIIPSDVPFVQQRLALPTGEATQALQFMMLDMFRGIGEYRVHEKASNGDNPTATQSKLDAAESAKLQGTQIKRYNKQHTIYYRKFYKRLTELTEGEKDYQMLERFKEILKDHKVPDEAWKHENIDSITSNFIAGAGSPQYKLMIAEKTIELTNMAPKDQGQREAQKDALAAMHGRDNVGRFVTDYEVDPTFNEQLAGWENEMLSNAFTNPADVKVMPYHNHVFHVTAHLGDMKRTISLVNEMIQKQTANEWYIQSAGHRIINQGAHIMGHMEFLKKDKLKEPFVKQVGRDLNELQREADQIQKNFKAMQEQKSAEYDPSSDPEMQKKIASNQLELMHKEKMMEISSGAIALKHKQRLENDAESAAQKLATQRIEARNKKAAAAKTP